MRLKPHPLFWGMVSVSAALHIAASIAPWPQPSTPTAISQEGLVGDPTVEGPDESVTTSAIALTQLPKRSPPAAALSAAMSTASANPSVSTISPPLPIAPSPPNVLAADPVPLLPLEAPVQRFEEIARLDPPPEQPAPESDSDSVDPENSQPSMPQEIAPEIASEADQQGPVLQLAADFPHLAGSQSGCYGLSNCHQTSGNYRQVVRQLTEQMRNQGYQLTEDDTIDGIGHRVFEVVMPHEPSRIYYLNVFSDDLDTAVYAITLDILSLDELKSIQA